MARPHLRRAAVDGVSYWLSASAAAGSARSPRAVLLPSYDEYTVAYRDRSAVLDPRHAAAARNGIFTPPLLLDGRIVGTWTRRVERDAVAIDLQPFAKPTAATARAIAVAAARYGRFVGRPARIV